MNTAPSVIHTRQTSPEVEQRIVELRKSHPGWGPRTILNKLSKEFEQVPSRAAIHRCLVRRRLMSGFSPAAQKYRDGGRNGARDVEP